MSSPNQIFQSVAVKTPPRSRFDLTHTWKSTADFAQLIPNLLLEVMPGDAIRCNTNLFARAMPMLAPLMHAVDIYEHYFFVPWRLIWDDYEKFIIPQEDETEDTIPVLPYFVPPFNASDEELKALWSLGSLADYFGIPPVPTFQQGPADVSDVRINSLPFRAYQLIYNEYYRDQKLIDKVEINKGSGAESVESMKMLMQLRMRAWEKDYFTSALPKPQQGNPVGFNIDSGSRLVTVRDSAVAQEVSTRFVRYRETQGNTSLGVFGGSGAAGTSGGIYAKKDELGGFTPDNVTGGYIDPNGVWVVEPGNTNPITIEQLRQQMRLQEYMELLMRGGNRYTEVVRNLYGVTPDDLRIGRPAYLGGGKQNLVISEVLQQSQSEAGVSALGEGAGHGISIGSDNRFKAFFREHGYVIGILSIRPRSEYGQGIDKLWLKDNRYDFANPKFAHLGEQPVKNGELWWSYYDGKNREGFGYQPVYEEYRHKPSTVHGDLRRDLAYWTLSRRFENRPRLNADFVQMSPSDFNNIFAVTEASDGSHLIVECEHQVKMLRPLPKYGVPSII